MTLRVQVVRDNLDQAIRGLRRLVKNEGLRSELIRRAYYIKPNDRRRRTAEAARYRHEKKDLMDNLRIIFQKRTRGF